MFILTYSILCVLGGWLLRGAISGRWRQVKEPHRLGDSRHLWIEIHGHIHAFTDDQLDVASARADAIADPKQRLRRWILWILAVSGLVVIMLLTACGYAKHKDPPLYRYDSAKVAQLSAEAHAKDSGNAVHQNLCCNSMAPYIVTGDWIVTHASAFGDHLLGKAVVYRPKWNAGKPVLHRLVSGNAKDGFIASGDNNPRSEASERVTAANYDSEVVGIYRYVP